MAAGCISASRSSEERLEALLRPGDGIDTLLTADAYGAGEADRLLGRSLAGVARDSFCLVGAIGHDFYEGEREGAKGFPRFTDPRLRGPDAYADYVRTATERSLERLGVDAFDVLLLHNPDRTGYTSPAVWEALAALRDAGLTRRLGVAPGPANGFTLDLIDCLERFGALIDWAMVILNPLEPWPGELCLAAAREHDVRRHHPRRGLRRPVLGRRAPRPRLRGARPPHVPPGGLGGGGDARSSSRCARSPSAHGLTPLQLAAQWCLAHEPVACVVPTLIQEPQGRPIEAKRAELAATPAEVVLSAGEVAAIRADRRQHRLDDAQGRRARPRGRAAPRPLAPGRRARRRRADAGASIPTATCAPLTTA